MISESLTIGLLLAIVFGAVCFYLYTRITYNEKRIGLMENILLDIKMNQEQKATHVLPNVPEELSFNNSLEVQNKQVLHNLPLSASPEISEQLPSIHEELTLSAEDSTDVQEYTDLLNQVHSEEQTVSSAVSNSPNFPNYDSMSKDELLELVKKRGLRAGNRPGREKLITLLQKADESTPIEGGGSFAPLQEAVSE